MMSIEGPRVRAALFVLAALQLNIATLPSARKARSHLPFQGRYNDILKL